MTPAAHVIDACSQSNAREARVSHVKIQYDVDFTRKVLEGQAEYSVDVLEAGTPHLVLDTSSGLAVHTCQLLGETDHAAPLAFSWGPEHKALGKPLLVPLPPGVPAGAKLRLGVRFTVAPESSAVQWLTPEQTADKKHPYLFTQCQAIHARALLPCQDTPFVKMSYEAAVRVPAELTALMSAVPVDVGAATLPGLLQLSDVPTPARPTKTFLFSQKVPVPSYLLALAVGLLESRELSSRSRVWSEPSQVDAAAYEFAETARYLDTAEEIAGPYVWGRYDLLLLPPSFPYGGMENPCLTFVTPTLLAGDRSLTNVVAHEIAHSWTGNLVTNASWAHFWLNEGFTVFLERKVLGRLHGEPMLQLHASNGALALEEDVKRFGADHPYTCLVPDMSGGVDPDDVFSRVPYEKGFAFLYYLQDLVGGPTKFEPFFRHWLEANKFKTVTSDDFRCMFSDFFKDMPAAQQVDWQAWYYSPGMPLVANSYDTFLAQKAFDLATKWHTADVMGIGSSGPEGASAEDVVGWGTEQLVTFLERLGQFRAMQPMHPSMTSKMARLYGLYSTRNSEIRLSFLKLAIAAEDPEALEPALRFVVEQGRMKFVRPLYRALFRSKMGKQRAVDTFLQHRVSYHPIASKMLSADLGVE